MTQEYTNDEKMKKCTWKNYTSSPIFFAKYKFNRKMEKRYPIKHLFYGLFKQILCLYQGVQKKVNELY